MYRTMLEYGEKNPTCGKILYPSPQACHTHLFHKIHFWQSALGKELEGFEVGTYNQSFSVFKQKLKLVVDAIFVRFLGHCYAYISTNFSFSLISLKSKVGKKKVAEFTGWLKGTPRIYFQNLFTSTFEKRNVVAVTHCPRPGTPPPHMPACCSSPTDDPLPPHPTLLPPFLLPVLSIHPASMVTLLLLLSLSQLTAAVSVWDTVHYNGETGTYCSQYWWDWHILVTIVVRLAHTGHNSGRTGTYRSQ